MFNQLTTFPFLIAIWRGEELVEGHYITAGDRREIIRLKIIHELKATLFGGNMFVC